MSEKNIRYSKPEWFSTEKNIALIWISSSTGSWKPNYHPANLFLLFCSKTVETAYVALCAESLLNSKVRAIIVGAYTVTLHKY